MRRGSRDVLFSQADRNTDASSIGILIPFGLDDVFKHAPLRRSGRAVSFDHAVPIVGITRRLWVEEAIHSLSTGGAFLVQLPIH